MDVFTSEIEINTGVRQSHGLTTDNLQYVNKNLQCERNNSELELSEKLVMYAGDIAV